MEQMKVASPENFRGWKVHKKDPSRRGSDSGSVGRVRSWHLIILGFGLYTPYGTGRVLLLPQAVNCLATFILSPRDKPDGSVALRPTLTPGFGLLAPSPVPSFRCGFQC